MVTKPLFVTENKYVGTRVTIKIREIKHILLFYIRNDITNPVLEVS